MKPNSQPISSLWREVFRQGLPLAACRKPIKDGVQDLARVHVARTAAAPGRRDQRRYSRPFGICHVARITKAATQGGQTMFRLPHCATPSANQPTAKESQMIHSTSSWIGSYWLIFCFGLHSGASDQDFCQNSAARGHVARERCQEKKAKTSRSSKIQSVGGDLTEEKRHAATITRVVEFGQ
jgi:hypothetical protein